MHWFYKLSLRLRSLFRKGRVEQELTDELRFHLQKLIDKNVAKEMTLEEARWAALRELGGLEQIKEECRDARGVSFVEATLKGVRYGLRMFGRMSGTSRCFFELSGATNSTIDIQRSLIPIPLLTIGPDLVTIGP